MVLVDLDRLVNDHLKYPNRLIYKMSFPFLSAWIIGGLEGYSFKEGGLPPNTVAGTMAVSTTLALLSCSDKISEYIETKPLSVFMGTSVFFGSLFYLGFQIGNSIRLIKDREEHKDDDQ